jgi:hypothetical protein
MGDSLAATTGVQKVDEMYEDDTMYYLCDDYYYLGENY